MFSVYESAVIYSYKEVFWQLNIYKSATYKYLLKCFGLKKLFICLHRKSEAVYRRTHISPLENKICE